LHQLVRDLFSSPRAALQRFAVGFIRFTESDGINVAWSPSPQRFIRNFANMRPAHHDQDAGGANCVCHAVSFLSHSGHGADADQSDVLLANKLNDFIIAHRARVSINQRDFMTWRGDCLEQEHPEVRHEITRYAVVGVVERDFMFDLTQSDGYD
jgi:hypothetical protein